MRPCPYCAQPVGNWEKNCPACGESTAGLPGRGDTLGQKPNTGHHASGAAAPNRHGNSIKDVGRANAEHEIRLWVTFALFCLGLWVTVGILAWLASGSVVTGLTAMILVGGLLTMIWGAFWTMMR